jgi:hypothetical protein
MKTRKEHNSYCTSKGIDPRICNETNQWMDDPVKEGGGCAHRKQRHGSIDCLRWALSGQNPQDTVSRYLACQIHREADRKTDRCGSEPLFRSNQTLIPLVDPRRLPIIRAAQELWRGEREHVKM